MQMKYDEFLTLWNFVRHQNLYVLFKIDKPWVLLSDAIWTLQLASEVLQYRDSNERAVFYSAPETNVKL